MSQVREKGTIVADVRLAQNGNGDAMNRIIEDVQDMVYYNCLRMLKNEQRAQDATQDILITVYQKIGTLTDPQAYFGWVKRITANTCKTRLCKVNKEFLLSENEEGEDPFANFEDTDEQRIPDKALDNEETRRMIVDLIDKLPDEQRMCVMLFYYDEMKTREIAETLSVSEGTIKSRLNYARKAIKEGVQAYEKQGVKLYGLSPIPFIGYFLGKAAVGVSAPIAASAIATAATAASETTAAAATAAATSTATATAATATAATATTTTAAAATTTAATAGGLAAFAATVVGKIVIGIAAAVVLGGAVTGTVIAAEKRAEARAVIAEATEEPTLASTVVPTEATTPEPTAEPTPEPTAEPTPEPTPEPETPEEMLERLTAFPKDLIEYLLEALRAILAGENELGFSTTSPISDIWEIHSVEAYKAYRCTDAWTKDVPESELPCYGARLEDGTELVVYLGDGLAPKDEKPEHEWVIYRVYLAGSDVPLYSLDYLDGPQWTSFSPEEPPEDALEVQRKPMYTGRASDVWGGDDYCLESEEDALEMQTFILNHPEPFDWSTCSYSFVTTETGTAFRFSYAYYTNWMNWSDTQPSDDQIKALVHGDWYDDYRIERAECMFYRYRRR